MGFGSKLVTSDDSDEESGEAFTDGDFEDSDEEDTHIERPEDTEPSSVPVNETMNTEVKSNGVETNGVGNSNGLNDKTKDFSRQNSFHSQSSYNSLKSSETNGLTNNNKGENGVSEIRRESHGDQNPSIVGIIGDQHNHAEQRLAARRAARAEAREIRMRELERQQREQEDHADKAYDMYTETSVRRAGGRLSALSPAGSLHSPRRCSEDSNDDVMGLKEMRHELKEVEEKFRKAMILNAQLDNDKAALGYQLELLKDRIEEQLEETQQLQREHREKCSAHERLKREHLSLERELAAARDAVRARDAAAAAAGHAFVEATPETAPELVGCSFGSVPPLALVTLESEQLLNDAGEGTLDVRLQKLLTSKQSLESEVRKLKLQLNEERAARQNGVASHHDAEYENELEVVRKSLAEAKARAARGEAEAALQGAAVARLEAQVSRLRARQEDQDEREELLKQEKRRLQREAREALNRVEELETENNHLTKRLDKLRNAKSALLKEL